MTRLFTEQELEELRRADAELDDEYRLTAEDIAFSRKLDKDARFDRMDNTQKKIADYQAAYREANREKYNAYMREYSKKRRAAKKAASDGANIEDGR